VPATDSAASVLTSTAADKQLYMASGLAPVECTRCGTTVQVKKNSAFQTSVQWPSGSQVCPEIAAAVAAGTPAGVILGCPALLEAIDDAVRDGRVRVPDA
jgi:hypothetical protein